MLCFHWKKQSVSEFANLDPLDYRVGAQLGRYQNKMPKPNQHCQALLKTALLSILNDLPQEFIDQGILVILKESRDFDRGIGSGHFNTWFKY